MRHPQHDALSTTLRPPPALNSSQDSSDTENEMPATEMSEAKGPTNNATLGSNPFDENESNVYVLFQYGKGKPLKYYRPRVNEATTIHHIKNELFVEWGVPIGEQHLRMGTTELSDNARTVKDYGMDVSKPTSFILTTTAEISEVEPMEVTERESSPPRMYGMMYGPMRSAGHASDSDNEMDWNEKRPSHDLVGLKNQGATCYLNSLIQMLYLTPEFRRMIYQLPRPYEILLKPKGEVAQPAAEENKEKTTEDKSKEGIPDKKTDIIFQMQMLFAKMQHSNFSSVGTSGLTTSFGWDNSDIFVQHDVQELNRVLCDNIEEKMKGKEGEYSIAKLYKGVMLNMIKCTNCNRVSTREEDYYDISLVIKGKKNISESFDEFTTVERMENENAYFCERCNSKQTAEKSIKFRTVPTILNLQLKRFEFDWEANMRVKLNDEIGFPADLDMSKYMVDPDVIQQLEKDKQQNGDLKAQESLPESLQYELIGVLVHTGNAGFGHYYAFIKNFVDGKWYKFNDEHVTAVEETDILSQNWTGSERTSYYNPSIMQRSATPYMLVYRRRTPPAANAVGEPIVAMDEDAEEAAFSAKKRRSLADFRANPIASEEIPPPILEYLTKEQEQREIKRKEREKELSSCTVTVFRNRVELPVKVVKVDKNATMEELRATVIAAVASESTDTFFYRFRRVANRKNHTRRPMQLYKDDDYTKPISDTQIDKKSYVYLEQDTDPNFPGLNEDFTDDTVFVSIRLWSPELRRSTSIRDFIFPKSTTLGQLKLLLSQNYVHLDPEEMVIVEEETEKTINVMVENNMTLKQYGIISGDILHVEPLSKIHQLDRDKAGPSFTSLYYQEKHNKLVVEITESNNSYKRRMQKEGMDIKDLKDVSKVASSENPEEWKSLKIGFQVATNRTHTLGHLKNVISLQIGVPANQLRIYDKDTTSYGSEQGRLLKDVSGKLGTVLVKYPNSKISTHLGLDILDHSEELKKGDKLIKTRYYNGSNNFEGILEILINKTETMADYKTKLKEKTGVPEDRQVISEWYNDHFYKLFSSDKDTIAAAKIRKMDILRMDVIPDPSLNPATSPTPIMVFQLVNFIAWDSTPYGRKEMQTSFPALLCVPDNISLFDLRTTIAQRVGLPYWNINVATSSNFPILEGYITPIRDLVKAGGEDISIPLKINKETNGGDVEMTDEDPEEQAMRLAAQENTGDRTFNFKSEKKVPLKRLHAFKTLSILCWEDLRKKVDNKPAQTQPARAKKNRDGEDLKIKN